MIIENIYPFLYSFIGCLILSSGLYLYLHLKTGIHLKYLFIDNIIVAFVAAIFSLIITFNNYIYMFVFNMSIILFLVFIFTVFRFYRKPDRKIEAKPTDILSPADGNVIYIKKITAGKVPISVKGKSISKLNELTKTDILKTPCWLIGINMTLYDVHKNCAPISGKIVLNKYFHGKFLSLKLFESELENERNTIVIQNDYSSVGIVQIASKRVRRIDTYVKDGDFVKQGEWIGMIRFGSQVDVIIPFHYKINIRIKGQVYARKTIIAKMPV